MKNVSVRPDSILSESRLPDAFRKGADVKVSRGVGSIARRAVAERRVVLSLGTVQFGMPYGAANRKGKPSEAECEIVATALEAGMMLDTASGWRCRSRGPRI